MSATALLKAALEQNRVLLVTLGSLSLLVFGLFLYHLLVVDAKLLELRLEQVQTQQRLRSQQAAQADSGALFSEAEQINQELQQFQNLVPEKNQFSIFIGELFQWTETAGLEIKQISYTPKSNSESGFLDYGLNFSVRGEYVQVKRFIHQLENAPRLLIIDRIALAGAEAADTPQALVNLQIHLTTYFRESAND